MRALDLEGRRFGRLTAIEVIGTNTARQRVWRCVCDCGKEHQVSQAHLTTGRSTSCGCYRKERATTHGRARTVEWFAYNHAQQRCKPKHRSHEHYFDRGILFKFVSFEEFFAEVGTRPSVKHSLDRIDNDKSYEIGNVRWATKRQQERNKSCDNCILLKSRIAALEQQLAMKT
jgi:hypothetical protein